MFFLRTVIKKRKPEQLSKAKRKVKKMTEMKEAITLRQSKWNVGDDSKKMALN